MKILGVGLAVSHKLIAIEPERTRRTSVQQLSFRGGARLVCDLVQDATASPVTCKFVPLNPKPIETFAESRGFLVDPDDATSKRIWRIDKIVGQTTTALNPSLAVNAGDCRDQLLMFEVSQVDDRGKPGHSLTKEGSVSGSKAENAWAVVKTEAPDYLGSKLYNSIWALHQQRQIVIMSLSTARLMDNSPLIKSLSWEATAEAIQAALIREIEVKNLSSRLPYAIIVTIMNDGAAYLRCDSKDLVLTLVYDPKSIEGEWNKAKMGLMPGTTQCVTAAVAAGMIKDSATASTLSKYVMAGLHGARTLYNEGFQRGNSARSPFPIRAVAASIRGAIDKTDETFSTIDIPKGDSKNPSGNEVNWSIAKQEFFRRGHAVSQRDVTWSDKRDMLYKLVRNGLDAQTPIPVARFDEFTAVIRDDIEGLRAIRGLMREYSARLSNKRPLSIAVFGSPGSGKSFGVKAVAKSIADSRRQFQTLEFNLSQFSAPDQIYQALHQVRDSALAGNVPLVFFDEFDTNFHGEYGWLRYFLAPMQDGKFTQGQISHSVGDAVFVFAGGTSSDMQTFRKLAGQASAAKGPDFLSRLQGFLNIVDLNHLRADGVLLGGVLIRRAILLRALVERLAPKIAKSESGLDIDESVMTAFLRIREFRYSARSMESILNMSNLQDRTRLDSSCLPPIAQIDLHVDSMEWLDLLEDSNKSDNWAGVNPYIISW